MPASPILASPALTRRVSSGDPARQARDRGLVKEIPSFACRPAGREAQKHQAICCLGATRRMACQSFLLRSDRIVQVPPQVPGPRLPPNDSWSRMACVLLNRVVLCCTGLQRAKHRHHVACVGRLHLNSRYTAIASPLQCRCIAVASHRESLHEGVYRQCVGGAPGRVAAPASAGCRCRHGASTIRGNTGRICPRAARCAAAIIASRCSAINALPRLTGGWRGGLERRAEPCAAVNGAECLTPVGRAETGPCWSFRDAVVPPCP
jgi:hypothetical protein